MDTILLILVVYLCYYFDLLIEVLSAHKNTEF